MISLPWSRLFGISVLLCVSVAGVRADDPKPKPVYGPVKSMSPEELAKTMGDQLNYEFELAPIDGLRDAKGEVIRANDLPEYLKAHSLSKDAYFILWVAADSPPLSEIAPTVKPLGEYGVTKIVVRARPGVTPKPGVAKPPVENKTMILKGAPNPEAIAAGVPFPWLKDRPPALRPDPLPRPVRYKFASDAEVIAAAENITACFLKAEPTLTMPPIYSKGLLVLPGAWKSLRADTAPDFKSPKAIFSVLAEGGKQVKHEGAYLSDAADCDLLCAKLHEVVQTDGGGLVRALYSAEMAKWWIYIGFDIEEPVLVLETAHRKHHFILCYSKGKLAQVDDLDGLPGKP